MFKIWRNSIRIEADFRRSLYTISDILTKIAIKADGDEERYRTMMENFQATDEFENYIKRAVSKLVSPTLRQNLKTWRTATRHRAKSQALFNVLNAELHEGDKLVFESQIIENASLIRTLPTDVANKVTKDIAEATIKGLRAESIAKIIRDKTDQHARASARLIARTEAAKTQSAITRHRAEALDLKWYVWRTALDGLRVRKSHRNMEDVLVAWSDPPSPEKLVGEVDVGNYHAGNIWNCRCYSEPLLDIDDVKWPHRVYYQNAIVRMTKHQFEEIM